MVGLCSLPVISPEPNFGGGEGPMQALLQLSAPNPAAGHRRPTALSDTPGHSRASLGQSLVGLLLLSPGS